MVKIIVPKEEILQVMNQVFFNILSYIRKNGNEFMSVWEPALFKWSEFHHLISHWSICNYILSLDQFSVKNIVFVTDETDQPSTIVM